MNRPPVSIVALLSAAALFVGCAGGNPFKTAQTDPAAPVALNAEPAAEPTGKSAVAVLRPSRNAATQPAANNVSGTVTFTDAGEGTVKVVADVVGLRPNTEHGFHVHENGDLSAPDLSSAGGHFNPAGHPHGAGGDKHAHAGDMGNLKADGAGKAHLELTLPNVTLGSGQPNDLLGKAVIVHGKADDLRSQPAGDAGPRIAGGVIEGK
ncbi:MAG TPA: superoxide dismutase family protein [Tepidisphaeraceae bacterium]|nr:superoxide dismutase family protein [Tepidisphaeraceae bacterium]